MSGHPGISWDITIECDKHGKHAKSIMLAGALVCEACAAEAYHNACDAGGVPWRGRAIAEQAVRRAVCDERDAIREAAREVVREWLYPEADTPAMAALRAAVTDDDSSRKV